MSTESGKALPADDRPFDPTPVHTVDLPPTPIRDRNIPAAAWVEAPAALLELGDDIGQADRIAYKRRLGHWLLWRAGPARGAHSRYMAIDSRNLDRQHVLDLFDDGTASGVGPSGQTHERFRTWKEDLNSSD